MKSHSFQNAVKSRNEVKQDRKRRFGVKSVFDHKRFDALDISTMSCLSYNNNTTGRFSRNVTVFSFSFSLSRTPALPHMFSHTHTHILAFFLPLFLVPSNMHRCTLTLSRFLSLTVCSPSKILALKTVPEVFKFSSNCWVENSDNLFDCSKHPTILTGLRCRTNFSSNTFRSILSHKIVSIVSSSSSS